MRPRRLSFLAALPAALFAWPLGLVSPSWASGWGELESALASVVDTRLWPEEAAALETRPYRLLLDRARVGPDEVAMRHYVADCRGSAERLLRSPEEFRGKSVYFTAGLIVELRCVPAPGVGRFDRDEVYAGIVARPTPGRPLEPEFFAMRALRLAGEPRLYPGDRVNVSGYFFKNVPVVDAREGVHWMPLLVCPWPTYYGKWTPIGPTLKSAGVADLFPTTEFPHGEVRSRPVLDVHADGRLALGGAPTTRRRAVAELRRFAFAHPGRAIVVRLAGGASERIVHDLEEESGVGHVFLKDLPGPATR